MKTNPKDRDARRKKPPGELRPALFGAILLCLGILLWFITPSEQHPSTEMQPAVPQPVAPVVKISTAPMVPDAHDFTAQTDIVIPVLSDGGRLLEGTATAKTPSPLTLKTADSLVREILGVDSPPAAYAAVLASGNLVERAVDLVAGAQRGYFVRRALPLPPPGRKFRVQRRKGGLYVDAASFGRYDDYVAVAETVDPDALASAFHTFRPLLEQAYGTLGFPAAGFDNALIGALDAVLATPVLTEPQRLVLDVTTYHYMDPELEALPSLQKQLLRMGPTNLQRLQAVAAQWRAALLAL